MRKKAMRRNDEPCVEEGDWVTLFSYEDNEIYELHIGEHYDSYLEKLCLGKRERDIVLETPKYEIQYVKKGSKDSLAQKENLNLKIMEPNVIYVYYMLNNVCVRYNHTITTVTLPCQNMRNGDDIEVNVFYCVECEKYFVNYEAVQELTKMSIFPSLKYVIEHDGISLKPFSRLRAYGYTVAEGVLSDKDRQRLLGTIIDKGFMKKEELIRDLEFKISYNGASKKNAKALEKWKNDVIFVSQYVSNNQNHIVGQLIRPNGNER